MQRRDLFALLVVLVGLLGLPAILFGYQAARQRPTATGIKIIDVVARAPEQGGFSPDRLTLRAGEAVRLRISSPDVLHGLTIPGLGVNVEEILPGKVVEVDVTPKTPGRYAFACTHWCSVDHWRMRGVIEVTGDSPNAVATPKAPLFQQLGIDVDAMPPTPTALPATRPSASTGAKLSAKLPNSVVDPASRRTVSPAAAFQTLRDDPVNDALSDNEVWNLVAWAWLKDVKRESLARAETLYVRDCAACHGLDGRGKGPAGVDLPGMAKMDPAMPRGPADFTDAGMMLAASDVLLQGKLLRGGMGTGMPEFGSLYSDEELWAIVAYLRTFLFRQ
jgi:mono/diheme cytochrome c family protein/plastocyanin